jgi:flagellar basal-body rod protein FlgB
MYESLQIFRLAQGMARHASARQATVAENIAQANTPGYRQRDLPSFAETVGRDAAPVLTRSRPGHRAGAEGASALRARPVENAPVGPNGNSVSIETEIMRSAEIRQQHDTALAIYRSGLRLLRANISQR